MVILTLKCMTVMHCTQLAACCLWSSIMMMSIMKNEAFEFIDQKLDWWNGRHSRLRICRREAWGFESPVEHC